MVNVKLLDEVEELARENSEKYGSCSQSTFWAIHKTFGYKDEAMSKAVVVLSGGVCGMCSVCGALTGSALGLGLKYGRDVNLLEGKTREEAIEIEHVAVETAQRLAFWFEREFGSIICYELRKSHMGTFMEHFYGPSWHREVYEELGTPEFCRTLISKTARRAAAIMQDPNLSILEKV